MSAKCARCATRLTLDDLNAGTAPYCRHCHEYAEYMAAEYERRGQSPLRPRAEPAGKEKK